MGHHTALALDDAVGQYAALALEILYGILCLAAAAFLRLCRDDDATEAAGILVSSEHGCLQQSDLALAHGVRHDFFRPPRLNVTRREETQQMCVVSVLSVCAKCV